MSDNSTDPVHQRILLGTQAAGQAAIERARQTGTPLVIWRDGQVVEMMPDEIERLRQEKPKAP